MKLPRLRLPPYAFTLLAALVLGAVSFQAARAWLSSQARIVEARVAADHAPTRLIVAAADLEAGAVLLPELLAGRNVPARWATSAAVRAEDLARVEGRTLAHPVRRGEPILWPAMMRGAAATFSAQLPPGRRAITVPVDEVNAFAGLLVPGDVIDLLYVDRGTERVSVRPLLQQVVVLATGTTTREDADRAGDGTRTFATVTVGVTPDEAQRIVLAQRAGELLATLRHPADVGRLADTALDSRVLRGAPMPGSARPRRAAAPADYVEFIVGGQRTREAVPAVEAPAIATAGLATRAFAAAPTAPPSAPSPTATTAVPVAFDPGDIRSRLGRTSAAAARRTLP